MADLARNDNSESSSVSTPPSPAQKVVSSTSYATTRPSSQRPPFLPTYRESVLLAIFPTLLLFGALYSVISPDAHSNGGEPVGPIMAAGSGVPIDASHFPSGGPQPPSYFARKNNMFNVFFVKRGWFWISLAFFVFLGTHPAFQTSEAQPSRTSSSASASSPSPSHSLLGRRLSAVLRWALITGWWILVTQWCFGPPLIDRSFRLTGGVCHFDVFEGVDVTGVLPPVDVPIVAPTAAAACKRSGGHWRGGHDISGHVFMLVLGCTFLVQEVGRVLLRATTGRGHGRSDEDRVIVMTDGAVKTAEVEAEAMAPLAPTQPLASPAGRTPSQLALRFVGAVVLLSLWMLLMTAIYFHTWLEKLTGLIVALTGLYGVYVVPRIVPGVRRVVGLPGL